MNPTLAASAEAALEKLQALAQSGDVTDSEAAKETAALAGQRGAAIRKALAFLTNREHPVAFIGSVGVGKSSLIGAAAALFVGERPTTPKMLNETSVLAVAAGRTTLCEVLIRRPKGDERGPVGLMIDPMTPEDMKREIGFFAEDEWNRKQTGARRAPEVDTDPTSLEMQRAIRGMTGYTERQEIAEGPGARRPRIVYPLDEAIAGFSSPEKLAEHLIERANLGERIDTTWWYPSRDPAHLRELKSRFASVNRGLCPTAALPNSMTVVVPDALPGSTSGLDLTLIDTRGLDGNVGARGDILRFLRDARAVNVICGSFKAAPDDTVKAVFRALASSADTRRALESALLVLVDTGDAEQVNDAGGDREIGQQLKIDECVKALESAGLAGHLRREQIVAFDVLNDERASLIERIDAQLLGLRGRAEADLEMLIQDAEELVRGATNELLPELRRKVDGRLRAVIAAHPLIGAPLSDPLEGVYSAIRDCRYPSMVYAACRRYGLYSKLDFYAATGTGAILRSLDWLTALREAQEKDLDALEADPAYALVRDHVRLRMRQIEEGVIEFCAEYGFRTQSEVMARLHGDPIWQLCAGEWRQGPGFKNRVIAHLESWSRRQQDLKAHEVTRLEDFLPLYAEAVRPAQAPQFTLHVRNLRALRTVTFQPDQVCALIGANGTGKTTLLETLRLLRVAYERGLSEAVAVVFKGGNNLKSWGAPNEEPIEIGVDLGEIRWRLQLIPQGGSVADTTQESLTDRGKIIFQRDSLGSFVYGNERIEAGRHIGLRTLMDRGAHEPSIRRMAEFLQSIHVHHDPDLVSLREGSRTTDNGALHPRGTNALTLLRRWYQERDHRHRFEFVLQGLDIAFPNRVSDIEFKEAGNNLVANLFRPGQNTPSPLADEANGVLQMLVLLCEIAATDDQKLVAIDEPENGLHPYALKAFFRRTSQWAKAHNVTVILATHSTVLLDRLTAEPEQVFVMKSKEPEGPVPTKLDVLYDRRWLESYVLGDLYEQDEIGSNKDAA